MGSNDYIKKWSLLVFVFYQKQGLRYMDELRFKEVLVSGS